MYTNVYTGTQSALFYGLLNIFILIWMNYKATKVVLIKAITCFNTKKSACPYPTHARILRVFELIIPLNNPSTYNDKPDSWHFDRIKRKQYKPCSWYIFFSYIYLFLLKLPENIAVGASNKCSRKCIHKFCYINVIIKYRVIQWKISKCVKEMSNFELTHSFSCGFIFSCFLFEECACRLLRLSVDNT